MILNILIVTKYQWMSRDKKHAQIKKTFMQRGNGITDVKFTTLYKDVGIPEIYIDSVGKPRIKEEWFEKNISIEAKMKGFNSVVFQFSTEDGRIWGIDAGHRGANFRDHDFFGECWVKCNENTRRKYKKRKERDMYEILIPHEMGHEFKNQGFTLLEMHDFDFQSEINNIESFYKQICITIKQEEISKRGRILDLKLILTMFNTLFGQKKDLYQAALKFVGTDASPADLAPDELGCAESLSRVIQSVFSDFRGHTGTWMLGDILSKDPRFERFYPRIETDVLDIVPAGTIILCRTVPGKLFPAHAGIVGENNTIFSNDSRKEFLGKFLMNYTLKEWLKRWMWTGGYEQEFYRIKN